METEWAEKLHDYVDKQFNVVSRNPGMETGCTLQIVRGNLKTNQIYISDETVSKIQELIKQDIHQVECHV